jgi:hypothetical protein
MIFQITALVAKDFHGSRICDAHAMEYGNIDTFALNCKVNGMGECLLKTNGQRVAQSRYGRGYGEIKEFPVPQALVRQGKLVLTWDDINEDFLNWRKQSRVTEVCLIKEAGK